MNRALMIGQMALGVYLALKAFRAIRNSPRSETEKSIIDEALRIEEVFSVHSSIAEKLSESSLSVIEEVVDIGLHENEASMSSQLEELDECDNSMMLPVYESAEEIDGIVFVDWEELCEKNENYDYTVIRDECKELPIINPDEILNSREKIFEEKVLRRLNFYSLDSNLFTIFEDDEEN